MVSKQRRRSTALFCLRGASNPALQLEIGVVVNYLTNSSSRRSTRFLFLPVCLYKLDEALSKCIYQ